MKSALSIAGVGLAVSLVVLGLKTAAYLVTGSIALYSDALETVINVVAALTALGALWYSGRPADANHPYGHNKAEYFSAVIEGALVLVTALLIAREAWQGWQAPVRPTAPFLGIGLNGLAGAINLAWALVLLRRGRALKSPALVAGGRHIMTDVWTTGAVLAGFALVPLTGWLRLDPAIAGLVAANILWAGYGVMRQSIGGLMDEVTDPESVAAIVAVIARSSAGAIEAHDIRVRFAGDVTFVECHLVVPGAMTVADAHGICDRIEAALRGEIGRSVVTIHVEPEGKAKHGVSAAGLPITPSFTPHRDLT